MKTDETDCGYKNHETFLISMDINNNNGAPYQNYWLGKAVECSKRPSPHVDYDPACRLAEMLRCHYERKHEDGVTLKNLPMALPILGKVAVLNDLLSAALERVEWREIAQELLDEVKQCAT